MSSRDPTTSTSDVFEQIEDALRSTIHGRAFLAECGRRARSEETTLLLSAVARLERQVRSSRRDRDPEEIRSVLALVESALRDARSALRSSLALPARPPSSGPAAVDAFARETTGAIVAAAELIQETAWVMREAGFDASICDRLDEQTSTIHAACRRQDRMLDGLSGVEHAIVRADGHVGDLLRMSPAEPSPPVLREDAPPETFIDDDLAFPPAPGGRGRSDDAV